MPKWEISSETVRYGWRRLWMVPNWSSSRRPERGPLEAFRQLRWCSLVWVCSYRHSRINVLAHGHLWKVFATHSHCFLSRRWSDPPWPWGSDGVRWKACPPITQSEFPQFVPYQFIFPLGFLVFAVLFWVFVAGLLDSRDESWNELGLV